MERVVSVEKGRDGTPPGRSRTVRSSAPPPYLDHQATTPCDPWPSVAGDGALLGVRPSPKNRQPPAPARAGGLAAAVERALPASWGSCWGGLEQVGVHQRRHRRRTTWTLKAWPGAAEPAAATLGRLASEPPGLLGSAALPLAGHPAFTPVLPVGGPSLGNLDALEAALRPGPLWLVSVWPPTTRSGCFQPLASIACALSPGGTSAFQRGRRPGLRARSPCSGGAVASICSASAAHRI